MQINCDRTFGYWPDVFSMIGLSYVTSRLQIDKVELTSLMKFDKNIKKLKMHAVL